MDKYFFVSDVEREPLDRLRDLQEGGIIKDLNIEYMTEDERCTQVNISFSSESKTILNDYGIIPYVPLSFKFEFISNSDEFLKLCTYSLSERGVTNSVYMDGTVSFTIDDTEAPLYVNPIEVDEIVKYLQNFSGNKFLSRSLSTWVINDECIKYSPHGAFFYIPDNQDSTALLIRIGVLEKNGIFGTFVEKDNEIVKQISKAYGYEVLPPSKGEGKEELTFYRGSPTFNEEFFFRACGTIIDTGDVPYVNLYNTYNLESSEFQCLFVYSFYLSLATKGVSSILKFKYFFPQKDYVSFQCVSSEQHQLILTFMEHFRSYTIFEADEEITALEIRYKLSLNNIRSFTVVDDNNDELIYVCALDSYDKSNGKDVKKIIPNMNIDISNFKEVVLEERLKGLTTSMEVILQEDISSLDIPEILSLQVTKTGYPITLSNYRRLPDPKVDPVSNYPIILDYNSPGNGIVSWGPLLGLFDTRFEEVPVVSSQALLLISSIQKYYPPELLVHHLESATPLPEETEKSIYYYTIGLSDGYSEEFTQILLSKEEAERVYLQLEKGIRECMWLGLWAKTFTEIFSDTAYPIYKLPIVFDGEPSYEPRSKRIISYLNSIYP